MTQFVFWSTCLETRARHGRGLPSQGWLSRSLGTTRNMTYRRTDQAYSRGGVYGKYLGDFCFESRPEELSWLNFYVVFLRHYKWVLRQYLRLGASDIFQHSLQCTEDSTIDRHVAIIETFVKYITNSFSFILEHTLWQQHILRKTTWPSRSQWLESG